MISNLHKMERPKIKNFFDEDVTMKQIHEIYLKNQELYNYTQSLDQYIDHLEHELRKSNFNRSLPLGFISTKIDLPENGETVAVITDIGRNTVARFEKFLGNEIWETEYDSEEDETVIGWKKIN